MSEIQWLDEEERVGKKPEAEVIISQGQRLDVDLQDVELQGQDQEGDQAV